MLQCKVLTGSSASNLETVVNTWLSSQDNQGSGITIEQVAMSEGSVGASALKVIVFYTSDYSLKSDS